MGGLAAARHLGLCRRHPAIDRSDPVGRRQLQDRGDERHPAARRDHQRVRRLDQLYRRRHPHHQAPRLGRALLRHRQRQSAAVLHDRRRLHGRPCALGRERELHQLARRRRLLPTRLRGRHERGIDQRDGGDARPRGRHRGRRRRRRSPTCARGAAGPCALRQDADRRRAERQSYESRRDRRLRCRPGIAGSGWIGSLRLARERFQRRIGVHLVADPGERTIPDLLRCPVVAFARLDLDQRRQDTQHAQGRNAIGAAGREHHARRRRDHRRHPQRAGGQDQPDGLHVRRQDSGPGVPADVGGGDRPGCGAQRARAPGQRCRPDGGPDAGRRFRQRRRGEHLYDRGQRAGGWQRADRRRHPGHRAGARQRDRRVERRLCRHVRQAQDRLRRPADRQGRQCRADPLRVRSGGPATRRDAVQRLADRGRPESRQRGVRRRYLRTGF